MRWLKVSMLASVTVLLAVALALAGAPPLLPSLPAARATQTPTAAAAAAGLLAAASARTHDELRAVVRRCRTAESQDVPALRQLALTAEDPLIAGNALAALGRLGAMAGHRELAALVADPRLRVRQEAVRALGASRDPASLDALEPVLTDPDPALRALAILAVGRIDATRARLLLEPLLRRADAPERAFVRSALAGASQARPGR